MSGVMTERWQGLQAREKALIVLGLLVLLGAASFQWLIEPVVKGRAQLAKTLPQARAQALAAADRSERTRQAAEARAARRTPLTETALREHLGTFKLNPSAIRIDGDAVELRLARSDLGEVLRWSASAAAVFAITIKTLDIKWVGDSADVQLGLAP